MRRNNHRGAALIPLILVVVGYHTRGQAAFVADISEAMPSARMMEEDGVEITVRPDKAVFAWQEPLAFQVTFRNTSQQSYEILKTHRFYFRFQDRQGKKTWMAANRKRVEDTFQGMVLGPGEARTVLLRLPEGVCYEEIIRVLRSELVEPQARDEHELRHLEKGSYQMELGARLLFDPAKEASHRGFCVAKVTFAIADERR